MVRRLIAAAGLACVTAVAGWPSAGAGPGGAAAPAPAVTGAPDGGRPGHVTLRAGHLWLGDVDDPVLRFEIVDAPDSALLSVTVHGKVTGRIQFAEGVAGGSLGPSLATPCATSRAGETVVLDVCRFVAEVDAEGLTTVVLPRFSPFARSDQRLRLAGDGVYPVSVVLETADGTELDRLVTHLVQPPPASDESPPLAVAAILPVGAPPTLDPDGTRRPVSDVLDLGGLAALVGPSDSEAGTRPLALTLDLTPETVEALEAVPVGAAGSDTWGDALAALGREHELLPRPYVDVDAEAWLAAGLGAELAALDARGAAALESAVGVRPGRSHRLAGDEGPESLDRLLDGGTRQVVVAEERLVDLDQGLFPLDPDQPFALRAASGRLMAAVMDDAALRAHPGATGDPVLDARHLVADLAVLYFQQPGTSRGVALTLPPDVDGAFLTQLRGSLGDGRVLDAVTIDTLFARADTAVAAGTTDPDDPPLVREVAVDAAADLGDYPTERARADQALATLATMVDDEGVLTLQRDRLDTSASSALGFDGWRPYLAAITADAGAVAAAVTVPGQERVTLAATEGVIPVHAHNDHGVPVTVEVRLASDKLEFPDGERLSVRLRPGDNRLEVRVRARATGAFPVDVSIWTPDGVTQLDQGRFTVRSTAVPGIGLVLSALAAAFLAVWWARHWRTNRRAQRLVAHPSAPSDEPPPA